MRLFNHRDEFHRHADRARDAVALRAVVEGAQHPAGCNCWLCCANDDDFTPPEDDPHRPNDERGWWEPEGDE